MWGGEEPLATQVLHDFQHAGFYVRVAIADTIGAAWAITHFKIADCVPIQSKIQNPKSAITIVPSGQARAWLAPLPVAALRLPEQTLQTLRELDLVTIGRLLEVPRSTLPSRLGHEIVDRLDQMFGQVSELIVPIYPTEPLTADWSFDSPTNDRPTLEAVLRRLLEQLLESLAVRQEGIQRLECRLFCTSGAPVCLTIGAVRPRASLQELLNLIRLPLERTALPAPVLRVEIEALAVGRLETEQTGLFDAGERTGEKHLATLIDRLSSRLGEERVLRPQVTTDAQPECARQFVPALTATASERTFKRANAGRRSVSMESGFRLKPELRTTAARPLVLKQPPQPVVVMSVVPEGPPIRFRWEHAEHVVQHSWGPERIETGWWRGPQVRRDYYRVETTEGRRFWLFREPGGKNWFLHGLFE